MTSKENAELKAMKLALLGALAEKHPELVAEVHAEYNAMRQWFETQQDRPTTNLAKLIFLLEVLATSDDMADRLGKELQL